MNVRNPQTPSDSLIHVRTRHLLGYQCSKDPCRPAKVEGCAREHGCVQGCLGEAGPLIN